MILINPVAEYSAIVSAMAESWMLVSDLLGGTKAMRIAATRHLPKWPAEEQLDYDRRLTRSTLFPGFSRTVTTLSAKPFSRPVKLNEDMPPQIKTYADDNIDMMNRNVAQFGGAALQIAMSYGMCAILVDFPTRDQVANTQAAEKAAGLRPYFAKINPTDFIGWTVENIEGTDTLTQFRYYECVEEKAGDGYTVKTIRQIKVLNGSVKGAPSGWEIWRMNPFKQWIMYASGVTTIGIVPVVPVYGEFVNFFEGKPPLIELAYLNVKHWQSQSDQDNLLNFARVPILTVTTDDTSYKFKIAGNVGVRIPMLAEMKYVEHTGKAIEAGKTSLDDLKDDMRQSGAELLIMRDAPATATEIHDDSSVGKSLLQQIVQNLQDSLNTAFQYMAMWINQQKGGSCQLYNEFGDDVLDDIMNSLLVGMPASGALSNETLFTELQRRWNIAPGIKWDDELLRINGEADVKQARAVDQATKLAAANPQPIETQNKNAPQPTKK